jgi:hypothetical protein
MEETQPTTEQVRPIPNPEGKGGFADNPQNINAGGRPKNAESFAYWYRTFKEMTKDELAQWKLDTPEGSRTIACSLALVRITNAEMDLKEFQEIADRSEGKATQTLKHEGEMITGLKVEIVNGTEPESNEGL